MFKKMFSLCVLLCLAAAALPARADDQQLVKTARKTLQTYDKAIITLSAVIKIEVKGSETSGQSQEQRTHCLATIIDKSGLAVAPLTNLAPSFHFSRGGRTYDLDCQVQEVKYRLSDGTEVPARLVLKDEDLDLAFLALLKPLDKATEPKMAFVPLSDSIAQPEMLDWTILISRTGEDLNYIPTLVLGRIVSLVTTPRICYISSGGGLGVPVFNHEGKLLGMICRCVKADGSDGSSSLRSSGLLSQLILPVADIMRLVPQAKEEVKKLAAADKKAAKTKKKPSEPQKKPAKSEKKPADAAKKPTPPEKKPADNKKAASAEVN
ncbi:MAG: trypsin-like peptidase domain-containing protein [Thermoguttaceae bacterium]|jgi:hypothetical protein